MTLDPLFGLFSIPGNAATMRFFSEYMERTADGMLVFKKNTESIGMYQVWYNPGVTKEEIPHSHRFLEIVVVVSGRGGHETDTGSTPISRGDIVFINNAFKHHFKPETDDFSVVTICFLPSVIGYSDGVLKKYDLISYFALLVPFQRFEQGERFVRVRPDERVFMKAAFYAFHLVELFFEDAAGNRETMHALFKCMLSILRTHHKDEFGDGEQAVYISNVLDYIHKHYREKITLAGVADEFSLSRTYFSTLFNRIMGKTLPQYVNEVRVNRARVLLQQTTLPIRRIAADVGCSDISHFNRIFQSIMRCTPRSLRGKK